MLFTFEGLIWSYVGAFSHATSEFDKVQGRYLFAMAIFFVFLPSNRESQREHFVF